MNIMPLPKERPVSQRIPCGGRILVKLIQGPEQNRKSEGGIDLPDTAENTQDCEGRVLAVSSGPGYELPTWVAERIAYHFRSHIEDVYLSHKAGVEDIIAVAGKFREPHVKVGDRVLFDITLASLAPTSENDDEFFIDENNIFALVGEDVPKIELTKIQADVRGYRTK